MICFEAKWPKAFICQKQQPRKTYRLQKKFWTLGRIGAMLLYIIIWSVDDPYFFFAFGMEATNRSKMQGSNLKILTVTKRNESGFFVNHMSRKVYEFVENVHLVRFV